ncbi:PREDICTED: Golgi integral membrane protein 4-like [Nicrophorus vespilloides]|uniref:Golgi integral membrane protein 4-like n=1 Tax=Nicrophorus vespilloides TaxID=110193 RepID=A0ABM1N8H7_NICVS|nr:PREDICTED: Golgi integral membrane protein 4-like [Nicrophorus vespilloides]
MTTSRIVRGTKARVFLYICAVLFITGLIACYNNVRIQLDETHKLFDLCRQEQENLSSQLQVIYDYKQRLEKSLKTEKNDYNRIKAEMELKVNEEKLKGDKTIEEAKLRFSTLQQHFNLLQTQHDDFKEESSKIQKEQLDEINNLQAKLKEVKEQLKLAENEKENSINHLKTQNELLQREKDKLLESAKDKSSKPTARTEITTTDFNKLVSIGGSQYTVENSNKAKNDVNQLSKAVLAKPSSAAPFNTSTPDNAVMPLKSPTATPETKKLTSSAKPLPPGVVPAPHQIIEDIKDTNSKDLKEGNLLNEDRIEVFNSNNEMKKVNQEVDFAMVENDDYDNEEPQGNMDLPIRD